MKKALISVFLLLVFSSFAHSELNIELLRQLYGENDGDRFGHCVANLGDINGDGFEDFGVGAPYYPEWTDTGRVYIYFGGDPIDLEVDMVIDPPTGLEFFGHVVCRIDDVSGDGVGELLVSATEWFMSGKVFLYFGGEELDDEPDMVFHETDDHIFGYPIATGDVNNDGFPDLVSAFAGYTDYMYVYLGSEEMDTIPDFTLYGGQLGMNGIAVGDVNGDSYDDIFTHATKPPEIYEAFLFFGRDSLHSEPDLVFPHPAIKPEIGDVNADGYGDIITLYRFHYGGEVIDTVYDVWLSKARLSPTVGKFNTDRYGDIVCGWSDPLGFNKSQHIYLGGAELDTLRDWSLYGGTWWNLGYDIAAVDLNADGVDEFLLGAPYYPDEPIRRGMVQVYTGDTTATSVEDAPGTLPEEIFLFQNYPNPFNSSTMVRFRVGNAFPTQVSLTVYDVQGRLVKELFDKPAIPGMNRVIWDGTNEAGEQVTSGVYFISLESTYFRQTQKAIFMK